MAPEVVCLCICVHTRSRLLPACAFAGKLALKHTPVKWPALGFIEGRKDAQEQQLRAI